MSTGGSAKRVKAASSQPSESARPGESARAAATRSTAKLSAGKRSAAKHRQARLREAGVPDLSFHDPHITYPDRDVHSIGVVAFSGNMSAAMDIIHRWAEENPRIQVYINGYLRPFAGAGVKVKSEAFLSSKVDLLLSLGGDGTFLSASRMVRGAGTPILGVNLGRVGFLADVTLENLHRILDEIMRREYSYRRRMLVQVEVWRGRYRILEDIALNDVALTGQMGYQMVDLRVSAQGRFLTDYWVDGLILSTPTGSTAYSLSAGGPIIHPSADSILLTPMNPTSLSVRPLVLPEYMTITVRTNMGRGQEVNMFVDGRNQFKLLPEHTVIVRKHPEGIRLVRPKGASYFESLRNKLGWTGASHARFRPTS